MPENGAFPTPIPRNRFQQTDVPFVCQDRRALEIVVDRFPGKYSAGSQSAADIGPRLATLSRAAGWNVWR
jgi:hypothetical protein